MRAARSMAATGIAMPIPIFEPVLKAPELADDELVLVDDALAPVETCAGLADDDFVLVRDVLGPVGAWVEVVELGECIVELVVVGEFELAIGMGL